MKKSIVKLLSMIVVLPSLTCCASQTSTSYITRYQNDNNANVYNGETPFWGDEYESEDVYDSPMAKCLKKLLNKNVFAIDYGTVKGSVSSLNAPIHINLQSTAFDLENYTKPIIKGNLQMQFPGTYINEEGIEVEKTRVETFLNFGYQNDILFFDLPNAMTDLRIETSSLVDAFNKISKLESPSLDNSPKIDTISLLEQILVSLKNNSTSFLTTSNPVSGYDMRVSLPNKILEVNDYSFSNLDFTIACDNEYNLTSLKTNSNFQMSINGIDISLGLDFKFDPSVQGVDFNFDLNSYVSMDGSVSAIMNLVSGAKDKKVNIEATIDDQGDGADLYAEGYANLNTGYNDDLEFNQKELNAKGIVTLYEGINKASAKANHKVEFIYKPELDSSSNYKDMVIMAEYRDTMRIKMHQTNIMQVFTKLTSIKNTNLLAYWVEFLQHMNDSMPIMYAINHGNYGVLMNDLVQNVSITKNGNIVTMDIEMDGSYIDYDGQVSNYSLILVMDETKGSECVKSLGMHLSYNSKDIDIKMTLDTYKASDDNISINESSTYFDFDYLPNFLQTVINTTELGENETKKRYYLNGKLNVGGYLNLLGSHELASLDLGVHAEIEVDSLNNNHTKAYLAIAKNSQTSRTSSDLYVTEYFIDEDQVYVCQTKSSGAKWTENTEWSWKKFKNVTVDWTYNSNLSSEVFKITREEFINNIFYYLVDYTIDLGSMIPNILGLRSKAMEGIYDAINKPNSDDVILTDYENYVSNAYATLNQNGSDSYTAILELGKILNISAMDFKAVKASITSTSDLEDQKQIQSLSVRGNDDKKTVAKVASILDLRMDLGVDNYVTIPSSYYSSSYSTSTVAQDGFMDRYDEFMYYFLSDTNYNARNLQYMTVNSSGERNGSNGTNWISNSTGSHTLSISQHDSHTSLDYWDRQLEYAYPYYFKAPNTISNGVSFYK